MSTTTENFMQRETITLEHAFSGAFSQIPPKTPNRNSGDVDFNDVFGGPPRRYSTQEAKVKYSFSEIVASEDDGSSSTWNGRKEKPVFRIDDMGRSRYPSDDFFDDIFRGDKWNIVEIKENETGAPKIETLDVHDSKSVKKTEEVRINSNRKDIAKSNFKGVTEKSSTNLGRSGVKGKVQEFVQNFNHEADSRPKLDIPMRSHSKRWKGAGIDLKDNEVNVIESKVNENVESNDEEKKPDVSLKVEKNMNKDDAQLKPQTKNPSFRKSFRRVSKVSVENSDDPFEDYFSVQELSPCHETVAQRDEVSEEKKTIDAKIRQWAAGKNGNIRSLLSTLQFVLWPGNEWKPVALVDLIETNAVKRAYQKALLRLHPDKLQQNSAASNKKYIAEKVFDLLQEAWDHFNTLAPL
ncbi:J domain-containing protein required for chloroplast accumulation response 1-like [Primulina huaijiensis]|uniref:J domain-containing protein required for chloroplast accumulation response 1-like n=1 Tax=Primulina huaijiensis TaxID=1492673 RepID=UPI003CC6E140